MEIISKKTRNKLEFLEAELKRAVDKFYELEKKVKDTNAEEPNAYLRRTMSIVNAILEYLELEPYETQIPDNRYMPKEEPMITITKVRKKSGAKK